MHNPHEDEATSDEIFARHRRWGDEIVTELIPIAAAEVKPLTNTRDPNRRLRIGFVSANFKPSGRAILPPAPRALRSRSVRILLLCRARAHRRLYRDAAKWASLADQWPQRFRYRRAARAASTRCHRHHDRFVGATRRHATSALAGELQPLRPRAAPVIRRRRACRPSTGASPTCSPIRRAMSVTTSRKSLRYPMDSFVMSHARIRLPSARCRQRLAQPPDVRIVQQHHQADAVPVRCWAAILAAVPGSRWC